MRKIIKIINIALLLSLLFSSVSWAQNRNIEFSQKDGKLYVREKKEVSYETLTSATTFGISDKLANLVPGEGKVSEYARDFIRLETTAFVMVKAAPLVQLKATKSLAVGGLETGKELYTGFGKFKNRLSQVKGMDDIKDLAKDTLTGVKKAVKKGGKAALDDYIGQEEAVESCSSKAADKCAPYCKYEPVQNCFLCPIFSTMFNAVNTITAKAITSYSGSVAKVVVFAFAIWLALQILRFVSSIETRDLKDLVQAIITQGFVVALVVIILDTGVANFFNTFITPLYTTGQNAAQVVFTHTETSTAAKQVSAIREIENGFSPEIGRSVIITMTTIENAVIKFRALGEAIMCYSFQEKSAFLFFPNMKYLITGLALWVFATVLIVALPFLMIDSVFQLGVVGALMPPAIGAYAFKYTRSKYTRPVWETFLNSMFAFVFISMVVLMLLGVLKQALVYGMGEISQTQQTAAQAEAEANGETTDGSTGAVEAGMQGGVANLVQKLPSIDNVKDYTKTREGRGEPKDGIYIDTKGFPTFGYGHLLFRADSDGAGSGGNHEKRFNAWYNERIKNVPFVDLQGKPVNDATKRSVFKKLYDTCAKRPGNKCVKSDANIVNSRLKASENTVDEALKGDLKTHYNKTVKNCDGKGAVVDECTVWSSFNTGSPLCNFHGDMCKKALTKYGLNKNYAGSATGGISATEAKFDTSAFESMFVQSSKGNEFFEEMLESFHWGSLHFVRLIFVFILGWSVMNMAKEFAGDMASSISNTSIGSSIGTMAASAAKGMAVKASKPLVEAAGRAVDRGVRYAGRKIKGKIKGAWTAHKLKKAAAQASVSKDGTFTDRKGFKHKMSEDGKTEIMSREKQLSAQTHSEANGNVRTISKKESIERHRSKEMTTEVKRVYQEEIVKDKDGKIVLKATAEISYEEKVTFHSISDRDLISRDGKVNQKLMNKMLEGKSPEEKQRIQRALLKKMHEQRFSKGVREQKLQGKPELVSERTVKENGEEIKEVTYKMITTKGEVVFETTRFRKSGLVETHQDIISKDGKLTSLSSDGLRNRIVTAELKDMKDVDKIKNYDDIRNFAEQKVNEKSVKARYSYSKYAQHLINHGVDPRDIGFDENGNQTGMMSWDEAVAKNNPFEAFVHGKGHEFEKGRMRYDILI